MRPLVHAILRLYPPTWRDRYGSELHEVLAQRPGRWRDVVDLARGALDARRHPRLVRPMQLAAAGTEPFGAARPIHAARVAAEPPRPAFGRVEASIDGALSRRSFLRRMLGAGVGLLSLEFIGGTIAFLWPPPADGIGVEHHVGTFDQIRGIWPRWDEGVPWEFRPARAFLVNVPAAMAFALGEPPSDTARTAGDLLALWRKCPHLGCMVPAACDNCRFQCLCHQSTYSIIGEKMKRGPAPRGMDRFPVRIDEDGVVIIDTREIVKGPPTGTITFVDAQPFDAGCA